MPDPFVGIPLQTPSATSQNAGAAQSVINGNPYAVEYVIPSHPLPIQLQWAFNNAQSSFILIPAPGANIRTALTHLSIILQNGTTTNVNVWTAFTATTVPTVVGSGGSPGALYHSLAAGGGIIWGNGSGIIALGGPNLAFKVTSDNPASGALVIHATYFQVNIA